MKRFQLFWCNLKNSMRRILKLSATTFTIIFQVHGYFKNSYNSIKILYFHHFVLKIYYKTFKKLYSQWFKNFENPYASFLFIILFFFASIKILNFKQTSVQTQKNEMIYTIFIFIAKTWQHVLQVIIVII